MDKSYEVESEAIKDVNDMLSNKVFDKAELIEADGLHNNRLVLHFKDSSTLSIAYDWIYEIKIGAYQDNWINVKDNLPSDNEWVDVKDKVGRVFDRVQLIRTTDGDYFFDCPMRVNIWQKGEIVSWKTI